jgi:hypothetical protein
VDVAGLSDAHLRGDWSLAGASRQRTTFHLGGLYVLNSGFAPSRTSSFVSICKGSAGLRPS